MRRRQRWLLNPLLFILWTAAAMTPPMVRTDLAITRAIQKNASTVLDLALSLATIVGNIEVTVALALIIGIILLRAGRGILAITFWGVFVAGSAFEWISKHSLLHPGVPQELQRFGINVLHYMIRTPYSYPSGHAFRTLLLAATIWVGWASGSDRAREPVRAGASIRYGLVVVIGLMGLALVYLGDHWMSEVVGGYLLAGLCVPLLSATAAASRSTGHP